MRNGPRFLPECCSAIDPRTRMWHRLIAFSLYLGKLVRRVTSPRGCGSESGGNKELYWHNLRRTLRQWLRSKDVPILERVNALPDRLALDTLYLVGEDTHLSAMAMLCPCGCGESVHLNLLSDPRSGWHVTYHPDGTVSVHPAIWRRNGCGSYFFVRGSRVYWWNTETGAPGTVSADHAAGFYGRSASRGPDPVQINQDPAWPLSLHRSGSLR
jgi:hypothetical protein